MNRIDHGGGCGWVGVCLLYLYLRMISRWCQSVRRHDLTNSMLYYVVLLLSCSDSQHEQQQQLYR